MWPFQCGNSADNNMTSHCYVDKCLRRKFMSGVCYAMHYINHCTCQYQEKKKG